MTKVIYWGLSLLLLLLILLGAFVLFQPPRTGDVPLDAIQNYYRNMDVWAMAFGALIGLLAGQLAFATLEHRPGEEGFNYNRRAMWHGVIGGIIAALVVAAFALAMAAAQTFGPLAPGEKAVLVVQSGLFWVVLAIAWLVALLLYAASTRTRKWGGQYSLIRRF